VKAKANPDDKVSDANRYHYNQEQVTIAVTTDPVDAALITEVGSHDIADTDSHVLMETGEDGAKLSSSITLTLEASEGSIPRRLTIRL
jgi:hypothetical protein